MTKYYLAILIGLFLLNEIDAQTSKLRVYQGVSMHGRTKTVSSSTVGQSTNPNNYKFDRLTSPIEFNVDYQFHKRHSLGIMFNFLPYVSLYDSVSDGSNIRNMETVAGISYKYFLSKGWLSGWHVNTTFHYRKQNPGTRITIINNAITRDGRIIEHLMAVGLGYDFPEGRISFQKMDFLDFSEWTPGSLHYHWVANFYTDLGNLFGNKRTSEDFLNKSGFRLAYAARINHKRVEEGRLNASLTEIGGGFRLEAYYSRINLSATFKRFTSFYINPRENILIQDHNTADYWGMIYSHRIGRGALRFGAYHVRTLETAFMPHPAKIEDPELLEGYQGILRPNRGVSLSVGYMFSNLVELELSGDYYYRVSPTNKLGFASDRIRLAIFYNIPLNKK